MKFLIDAQLPKSLRDLFIAKGFDCIHTSDLKSGIIRLIRVSMKFLLKKKELLSPKTAIFFKAFLQKKNLLN